MRFPWSRAEVRQSYSDTVIQALLSAASGEAPSGLTAALEICSGWWQRAFASAELSPPGIVAAALRPHLGLIGRGLVAKGEAVFEIGIDGGLNLRPASTVTVTGGGAPDSWMYELSLAAPSETVTRHLRADRVLHLRYGTTSRRPWRGVSPIAESGTTKKLLDNLETRLAQETGEAVGHLIPVPNVEASSQLQADIRALKGQVTLVESVNTNWGAGETGKPTGDFQARRIGADPPDSLRMLRRETEESILAACGVPVTVLGGGGTASREAYRQFLHLTIAPVALELARQIGELFDLPDFAFSFDRLMASDLSGRARAMQSMVNGGMPVDKAAALAGLMESEE